MLELEQMGPDGLWQRCGKVHGYRAGTRHRRSIYGIHPLESKLPAFKSSMKILTPRQIDASTKGYISGTFQFYTADGGKEYGW